MEDREVDGVELVPEFISPEEEGALLLALDSREWNTSLKRRTQHYGFEYAYGKTRGTLREAPPVEAAGPEVVGLLRAVGAVLARARGKRAVPAAWESWADQVIVNEYQPGQGIASHTDAIEFGSHIVSVSLGSDCDMVFSLGAAKRTVRLPRRSALVMYGDGRYLWKHEIAARKADVVEGRKVPRERRVSVTFRKVAK